jgi:hypothetical protein
LAPSLLFDLDTNHDRLPEAVNVEFSNYLAYKPKPAHFAAASLPVASWE